MQPRLTFDLHSVWDWPLARVGWTPQLCVWLPQRSSPLCSAPAWTLPREKTWGGRQQRVNTRRVCGRPTGRFKVWCTHSASEHVRSYVGVRMCWRSRYGQLDVNTWSLYRHPSRSQNHMQSYNLLPLGHQHFWEYLAIDTATIIDTGTIMYTQNICIHTSESTCLHAGMRV